MVRLINSDIRTRDVTAWRGIHIFHAHDSSCSQKLRIFMNLKRLPWISHPIDVFNNENLGEYYLGINPRGLVPAMVHDGEVHIESNDIIVHLEAAFPQPSLIPAGHEEALSTLLQHEDDLHLDLRTLTFRFVFNPPAPPKSVDDLARYAERGSGTVLGERDRKKEREIRFWQDYARVGITDRAAVQAAHRFHDAFRSIENALGRHSYLFGEEMCILDIAWAVYVHRLSVCGYPFQKLHPRINQWYRQLIVMSQFAPELAFSKGPIGDRVTENRLASLKTGLTFEKVCEL